MANFSTYAFEDISCVISHPSYGQYSVNGQGVGSITTAKSNEWSTHNLAADGSVMTSKVRGDNGTITMQTQQTSSLHNYMQGLFNYLKTADSSEWARISITIRAPKMKKSKVCTNVSIQKEPDEEMAAQGGMLSWVLLAGDIQQMTI